MSDAVVSPQALGFEPSTVIAVEATGMVLYRLVRSDPPSVSDFLPMNPLRARARAIPELLRCGLSHFLEPHQAAARSRSESPLVAEVRLPPGVHAARTLRSPGHVTVWGTPEALLQAARVIGVH